MSGLFGKERSDTLTDGSVAKLLSNSSPNIARKSLVNGLCMADAIRRAFRAPARLEGAEQEKEEARSTTTDGFFTIPGTY